jgi:flagellar hook-basal body complex protein FliE
MTAPIAAIGAVTASGSTGAASALGSITAPTAATMPAVSASSGSGFSNILTQALGTVQAAQSNADGLAVQAATGTLTNVQDYMVAAEQANIDTQLTVAVRNNAVQAFQQIMAMPL